VSKLWQKKYELNKTIEQYTVGKDYLWDVLLAPFDCKASKVHAAMLGRIGILSKKEVGKLHVELDKILEAIDKGKFIILPEQEDCHTAIEDILTERLGDLGKKIHTARSRNDQVLTAMRLYVKEEMKICEKLCDEVIVSVGKFAKKYGAIVYPGYTHMRKAMPSTFSLWSSSFTDSLKDNQILFEAVWKIVDQCPLGTAAGYGVPMELDREFTAKEMGFARVQENAVYAQHSRGKFEGVLLHYLSQVMWDLNRLASDLILYSMAEFGYIELPDNFCTGSSIMPQKKNPDVLELMRAKFHVVYSYEQQVFQLTSDLMSGYNRDVQLTKGPVIKAFEEVKSSLEIAVLLFREMKVNKNHCERAMSDELFATERVYDLVKKGVPFREAYQQVSSSIHP
jgi:argininosuccinate lyase